MSGGVLFRERHPREKTMMHLHHGRLVAAANILLASFQMQRDALQGANIPLESVPALTALQDGIVLVMKEVDDMKVERLSALKACSGLSPPTPGHAPLVGATEIAAYKADKAVASALRTGGHRGRGSGRGGNSHINTSTSYAGYGNRPASRSPSGRRYSAGRGAPTGRGGKGGGARGGGRGRGRGPSTSS